MLTFLFIYRKIETYKIVEWHYRTIVEGIKRRITFRQNFKNPWGIEISERIQREIFISSFQAIRDYSIEYGRTIQVERDNKGIGKIYTITFTHLGSFSFHLRRLAGIEREELSASFVKTSKITGTAEITVSVDKPAIFIYKVSTSALKLTLSYSVKNRYGLAMSF